MWEISSNGQLLSFFYALITGALFCIIYDLFKAFRLTFRQRDIAVFFEDILYFIIISVISFVFFLIFTNGEIRFYILIGLIIGFYIWKITFSDLLVYVIGRLLKFIRWIFNLIKLKTVKYLNISGRILLRTKKFFKNIQNRLKKLLKRCRYLLYTMQE